jgi:hypothetical protein
VTIAHRASIGTGARTGAGTSWSVGLSLGADTLAGDLLVLVIVNEAGDADGAAAAVPTSVIYGGHTATYAGHAANVAGTSWSTVSVWYLTPASTIAGGSTLAVTWGYLAGAAAVRARAFTRDTAASIAVAATGTRSDNAADPAAVTATAGTSAHTLFLHGFAGSTNSAAGFTQGAGYTSIGNQTADTGTSATSIQVRGGYLIATTNTSSPNPTFVACDNCQILVMFREASSDLIYYRGLNAGVVTTIGTPPVGATDVVQLADEEYFNQTY